jgi:adenosine kinase
MNDAHRIRVPARHERNDLAIGIIAPDGREGMWQHSHQMAEAGVPFIFDPGQQLPQFNGEELLAVVQLASWVAVNDYEGRMLCERTGLTLAELSRRTRAKGVVVTLAHEGADVWQDGTCMRVPGVQAREVVDPTGCGDAFRAALLYGLERGWPLPRCVALGNRLGALKIASRGGQNHAVDAAALLAAL